MTGRVSKSTGGALKPALKRIGEALAEGRAWVGIPFAAHERDRALNGELDLIAELAADVVVFVLFVKVCG